jgi:hypothetical protein
VGRGSVHVLNPLPEVDDEGLRYRTAKLGRVWLSYHEDREITFSADTRAPEIRIVIMLSEVETTDEWAIDYDSYIVIGHDELPPTVSLDEIVPHKVLKYRVYNHSIATQRVVVWA